MVASSRNIFNAVGSVAVAGAVVLRRQPGAPEPAPAPAPPPAPAEPADVCGCAPPVTDCTCEGTMNFAHCVAMACHNGCLDPACSAAAFFDQCGKAHDRCGEDLTMNCGMDEATCIGNYHQAPDGIVGLKLETAGMTTNAHCGPHGKCLGSVLIKAEVRNAPVGAILECVMPKEPSEHPAPGSRETCLSGAVCDGVAHAQAVGYTNYCCEGGSTAPNVTYGDPSTCSCASTYQEDWLKCIGPVGSNAEANCSMSIENVTLDVGVDLKGSCWLATAPAGDRLTQHAHFLIENSH